MFIGILHCPTRRTCDMLLKIATVIALATLCFVMFGCAAPGQPPNLGNALVGFGTLVGDNVAVDAERAKLDKAYMAGKISYADYLALNTELQTVADAFAGLSNKITLNQPVTQAEVDTVVTTLLVPLQAKIGKYIGSPTLPPPLPPTTKP